MNWNQLQYVITIAEEKNITRAAAKLFISQPSLSLSIQSLEKELGTTLFERNRGMLCLTYAGELFYSWAKSTLHTQAQLHTRLQDIAAQTRRLIRIGISPHRSAILVPDIMEQFYALYPQSEIYLAERPTYQLKKMLEEEQLDLIIDVPHPDTINYKSIPLSEEKLVLAVPDRFLQQMNSPATVHIKDLSDFPFIMLSDAHIISVMSRRICEAAGFQPDIRLTCTNLTTILQLVEKQLGAAIVPEYFARRQYGMPDIHYFPLKEQDDSRSICLIYRKNSYLHAQMRTLIELFQENTAKLYQ